MITITGFLLILASIYATIRLLQLYSHTASLFYLCLSVAAISLLIGLTGYELNNHLVNFPGQAIFEWSRIVSICLIISGLAILLWYSKPHFARFPIIFSALPLLLIPAYGFIIDSPSLKLLVLNMLQGGAIVIGFMLYLGSYYNGSNSNYFTLSGIAILAIALLVDMITVIEVSNWVLQLIIAIGIITITYGIDNPGSKNTMTLEGAV